MVLGRDPALGEGQVLRHRRVEVVAHHEHVEVLVEGVDRVRAGRVGRRGQEVRQPGDLDDVRRVPAAGALGVVGVDRPAGHCVHSGLQEPGLVEGVGVDRHLHAGFVGNRQARVDRGGRGAPVLVQLEPAGAGHELLAQRFRPDRVPLAQQQDVDRLAVHRLQHPGQVPRPRRDRGGLRALRWAGAAADERGQAGGQRGVDELRADEVDVAVDAARREDLPVAGQDLRGRPDHQGRIDAVHGVRVARLADADDPAVAHADVGLDHAPVVEHDGAGDDQVRRALGARRPCPGPSTRGSPCRRRKSTSSPEPAPMLRSSVTSMSRSVSASRIRSPVVGPNSSA